MYETLDGANFVFCARRGDNISHWIEYPGTVEEFIDDKRAFLDKDTTLVFVENETVYIYFNGDLYQAPEIPKWCEEIYS